MTVMFTSTGATRLVNSTAPIFRTHQVILLAIALPP
jgi:hypothetical protein